MGWFRTANRCAIMFELLLILIECLAPANALNYTEIKSTLMVDFDDNELITYKTDNSQARLVKSVAASMVTWPQNSTKEETDYVFVAGVHTFTDSNSAPTVMAAYVASYLARGPINDRLGLFWGCKNDEKSAIVNSAHAVQQMRYSPAVVEGSDDSQLTWNMYNSISYFNTAMVSCCAQAETLNNLGRYPLLFKIAPDIKVMVDKLRYILYHFNWRRLGVVSLADTFGENCQSAVIDTAKRIPDFEQLDAVLVSSSILSRDTAKRDEHIENLKKGLQELKAKNQRIICFCGSTGDFQVVYNTARALDMVNEDYSWIAFNIRKQDLVDWRIETESRDENAMVGIMSLNLACNTSSGSYTNMWAFLKDNFIRDVELTGVGQEWTLCYAYDAASVQHMALAETVKRLDQINIDYNRSITHECLGQIYYQANFEKCNLPEPVFVEYTQHCDLRYSAVCTKNCRVCGLLNYMQSLDQYYYPPQLIFISVVHGIDLVDGATGRVRFDSHGQRMGLDMLSALFNLQKLKDGQTEEINIHSDNIDTPDVGLTLNVSYFESTDDQSMFDSRLYRRTAPMDERRCHARQRRADAEYIKANTSLTYVMVASLESTPYKQAAWDSLLYDVPLAESALDYIPITNSTAQDAENILMVVDGMLAAARDAVESSDELSSLPEGSVYDLDTSNLTQQQINALMQELTPYVSLMPVMF